MIQQLGAAERLRRRHLGSDPHRRARAVRPRPGVSLPTSPFLDLATLKQYKTIVFNSTVGGTCRSTRWSSPTCRPTSAAAAASSRSTARTDSMQNVPWYMDLVGAGFTNHGSNAGRHPDRHRVGRPRRARQRRSVLTRRLPRSRPLVHGRGALQHQPRPGRARHRAPARLRERGLARRPDRLRHRRAAQHRPARHGLVPQLRRRPLLHHAPSATTGSSRPSRGSGR